MKQLDPKVVWLFFISYILRWLIPVIFIGLYLGARVLMIARLGIRAGIAGIYEDQMGGMPESWFFWVGLVAFFVLCFLWAKLTYKYYRYELTEDGFRKESGVIYKRYVTIPYDRIQNVDIYRGILARLLGLSDLQIQTAGASAVMAGRGVYGAGAEGRLPGLSREIAEQLRDELVKRSRSSRSQGL